MRNESKNNWRATKKLWNLRKWDLFGAASLTPAGPPALAFRRCLRCASAEPVTSIHRTPALSLKKPPEKVAFLVMGAGVGFEPHDLQVMSLTSYRTAPSRDKM